MSKIAEKIERIKAELKSIGIELGPIDQETVDHIRADLKNELAAQIDGVGVEYQVWSLGEYGDRFITLEFPTGGTGKKPEPRVAYAGGDYVFALAFVVGEIAKEYVS